MMLNRKICVRTVRLTRPEYRGAHLVRREETDENRSAPKQIPRINQDRDGHRDRERPPDGEILRQHLADIVARR